MGEFILARRISSPKILLDYNQFIFSNSALLYNRRTQPRDYSSKLIQNYIYYRWSCTNSINYKFINKLANTRIQNRLTATMLLGNLIWNPEAHN